MELIRELETTPRGIYCGAIGHVSPGGEAVFSVAIRTALLDPHGNGVMGIGSGVTWDSRADSEHRECLAKGAFLAGCSDRFSLIESLRHDESGYLLLERHLARLAASAVRFGFPFYEPEIRRRLDEQAAALDGISKVRLQLEEDGTILLETVLLGETAGSAPVALAEIRISSADPFLRHKTTLRTLYDRERSAHPDCYDVIFRNERDEVTEGSYNSVVILTRGELLTPALSCGLLPGVLRQELIDAGGVREAVLTVHDLVTADRLWLINSVRGWRECVLQ